MKFFFHMFSVIHSYYILFVIHVIWGLYIHPESNSIGEYTNQSSEMDETFSLRQ
jgi:ABC-type transporter Mla maintaining outer membrane lipid asymmetry permease subunit MlaE